MVTFVKKCIVLVSEHRRYYVFKMNNIKYLFAVEKYMWSDCRLDPWLFISQAYIHLPPSSERFLT
jgi:hypothetical protein